MVLLLLEGLVLVGQLGYLVRGRLCLVLELVDVVVLLV